VVQDKIEDLNKQLAIIHANPAVAIQFIGRGKKELNGEEKLTMPGKK